MNELIVEVDRKDKVKGLRLRSEFYTGKYIHRAVHLILLNSKGEMLVQKRAGDKDWYPGLFTYSASGTARDESYEECINRETKEEIGIKPKMNFLFKYYLEDKGVERAFHAVFLSKSDDDVKPDSKEISSIKWVNLKELEKKIRAHPENYTPSMVKGMTKFFKEYGNKTKIFI